MKRFSPLPIALTLLTLVVGSGLASSAWARLPEHGANRAARFEAHLQGHLQQLGLNESQQSTVQTLERTHAKEVIRLGPRSPRCARTSGSCSVRTPWI